MAALKYPIPELARREVEEFRAQVEEARERGEMREATREEHAVLARLIDRAFRPYSGRDKYVADFLLAWWNAKACGGFNLAELWGLDAATREDVKVVLDMICRCGAYPDTLGYQNEFVLLVHRWRPELCGEDF